MKADVLTLTAVVFVVGMLVSGLGITEVFDSEVAAPPAELQQGVVMAE
jgi:hypothetical protein